jgi:predicted secreted protein
MPKRYGKSDDKIDARVGEPFTIELEGNATTGYRWQLELADDKVRLVDEQYVGQGGGAVGAGGKFVFTVEPVTRGQTTIRARYKRPWDAHTPEQQEFRLDIED